MSTITQTKDTTSGQEVRRCEYCWHPPHLVRRAGLLHNEGCPILDEANMTEWKRGRAYGFNDNHLEWWQYRFYTKAFVLGCRVGEDEIDTLVEEAAQSRE